MFSSAVNNFIIYNRENKKLFKRLSLILRQRCLKHTTLDTVSEPRQTFKMKQNKPKQPKTNENHPKEDKRSETKT